MPLAIWLVEKNKQFHMKKHFFSMKIWKKLLKSIKIYQKKKKNV